MSATPFHKILIANRGEIALRVIGTAQRLGYRTVAVYSDADADAPYVHQADEAVRIGPPAVGESYLNIPALLDAARRTGADAVHPGYGFLSENAGFARACAEAGLIFIGPPVDAIELMGSKRLSKLAMLDAGVPCVPGYQGADQSDERLYSEAQRIGTPLMIKASAGGGGRGMRLVHDLRDLSGELQRARSEALNAFGSDELILERAVIAPRHIEIQVFADKAGNTVYLGERDCSVQRRHQKVVEEAPSPFVTPALRADMGAAAVQAAKACGYVGAGTVEFLVDADRHFYFLEMNTRLQVEHPVTELITGQDLVEWQLRVAAGEYLPLTQEAIHLQGHAIEVRLYAEDPRHQYTPQTGTILSWQPAHGEGIRIDSGIAEGSVVSPWYDPMLAKLIAYGRTRDEARRRLIRCLEDSVLFGVTDNRHYLARILAHPAFAAGQATTAFLQAHFASDTSVQPLRATPLELALAAILLAPQDSAEHGWRTHLPVFTPLRLAVLGGEPGDIALRLCQTGRTWQVSLDAHDTLEISVRRRDHQELVFTVQGVCQKCQYRRAGDTLYLQHRGRTLAVEDRTHQGREASAGSGSGRVLASMDGAIVALNVQEGDTVSAGQTLVVLEAMKMEHPLKADLAGTVRTCTVSVGDQVKRRQLLIHIDAGETHP